MLSNALTAARTRAESMMTDTCTVRYPTGTKTTDPTTGSSAPVYTDRFTSKCKIQTRNLQAQDAEVGGRTATTVRVEIHLPVSAAQVNAGDVIEVTAVGALSDMQLLGRKFRVIAPVGKSFATARRLEVEEIVA